jgi:hypothetical protein
MGDMVIRSATIWSGALQAAATGGSFGWRRVSSWRCQTTQRAVSGRPRRRHSSS